MHVRRGVHAAARGTRWVDARNDDARPGDEKLPLAPLFAAWWQSTDPSSRLEANAGLRLEADPSLRLEAQPSLRLTADGQGWLWSRAAA